MVHNGKKRVTQREPPEAPPEDAGEKAIEEYRAWRRRTMGSGKIPRPRPMHELLASMKEEPPGN